MDSGRPGDSLFAFSLATHDGALYAGTCEPAKNATGRVYRYEKDKTWVDCGRLDASNSVTALTVYQGKLYAGTGKYRVAGSSLPESENTNLGGKIFRYEGGKNWTDCGQLPGVEAVGGMVVFRNQLYASSLYKPAGFYRYENNAWVNCGVPDGKRVEALAVYNDFIYASSYDGGKVYRYDGKSWTDCGQLGDNTQTYSFTVYKGKLLCGTWPSGKVYQFEDINQWTDMGRLGEELEVMGMSVYNGRLLAGTLPLAEVYSYEGPNKWVKSARLDHTPDVKYRRAWTMAEHQGKLFCSTLPSGKIHALECGRVASMESTFPDGWHHVSAMKRNGQLMVFVDGKLSAVSSLFTPSDFDLTNTAPLWIGKGMGDFFCGKLSDVRIYNRALDDFEINLLATPNQ